jgi:4'-phosphopantetheinyl transferase
LSGPINWTVPPERAEVPARGQVHVWRCRLDAAGTGDDRWLQVLSDDEIARAGRIRVPDKQRQFRVARTFLRLALGWTMGVEPASLRFAYGAQGKPYLPGAGPGFNLAHSGGMAVLAMTSGAAVGVDIEQIRPRPGFLRLARRFFSDREVQALESLAAARRLEAFYSVWTRKEAVVKALGSGISAGLDHFDVTVDPQDGAAVLATRWPEAADWWLADLAPEPGYRAAAAIAVPTAELRCFEFNWPA